MSDAACSCEAAMQKNSGPVLIDSVQAPFLYGQSCAGVWMASRLRISLTRGVEIWYTLNRQKL